MAGQGKYTKYTAEASPKNALLGRLFKGSPEISNPYADLVGKEEDARLQTIARAKELLTPRVQQGDPTIFPQGVNMYYEGDENGISAPEMSEVKWRQAGDPANPFAPDISSPGPGKTDPLSKDVDPKISIEDLKGPGYVPGAPGTGTKSPNKTSAAIKENSKLGVVPPSKVDVNGFG